MKRGIVVSVFLMIIIILSFSVNAANETESSFDKAKAFEWLNNEMQSTNWGVSVDSLAWSILALRNGGYDVSEGIERLKQLEDNDYNWDNDVYDSSLAVLALYKTGNDIEPEKAWLLDRQKEALKSGEWLIQFLYDGESECRVRYDGDDFDFTVNDTEIISPSDCGVGDNWVDFEDCIKEDDAEMVETLTVSCLDNVDVSLLFKSGDDYYIVDQTKPLKIENACFYGEYSGCRCSVTQYASWVLQETGERPLTIPYLRSNCNENILDTVFLYMLTSNNIYSNSLLEGENRRSADGGWDNDFETTAMAIIALRDTQSRVSSSIDWLEFYQDDDGSWEGDVRTTAKVLYAITSEVSTPVITTNTTNGTSPLCGNGVIDSGEQCEYTSDCTGDSVCTDCLCVAPAVCDINADCDYGEECFLGKCIVPDECESTQNCIDKYGAGYECSAGQCKLVFDGAECTVNYECEQRYGDGWICDNEVCVEKGGSWLTWLIVILIILLGLAGAWFGYRYYKGRSKSSRYKPNLPPGKSPTAYPPRRALPTSRPAQQAAPRRAPVEDRMDAQLDKAIKKAKDILGGK